MQKEASKRITVRNIFSILFSAVFALVGCAAAAVVIYISTHYTNALPVLTFDPAVPRGQVTGMMDALCSGDFAQAEQYMQNVPDLGTDARPEDDISAVIWDAFVESMRYSLSGDCTPTEDGLTQQITFTCLDIPSVTANLQQRSQELLKERVANAVDVSEIYTKDNEYRTDVVRAVLLQAVEDALENDAKQIASELSINLKYQNGQWWILADQELLDVLFGDVLFYSA